MRILIHCSSGPAVGLGHVVRSAALAEEAVSSGHEVTIAGRLDDPAAESYVAATGAERATPRGHFSPEWLRDLVEQIDPDVVHLDSYADGLDRLASGSNVVARRLLSNMVDGVYGARAADISIDATLGAEEVSPPPAVGRTTWLRGVRYAPLRRAVVRQRGQWRPSEKVDQVLVVMGGTDPLRLSPRVLGLLDRAGRPLEVTAVVPPGLVEQTTVLAGRLRNLDVTVLPPVADLPALVVGQDLVLSAAGTTAWELCCIGVPMGLVCAVDNQRAGYERLVAEGAAAGVGAGALDNPEALETVRALLDDPTGLRALAARAAAVVDGSGSWRVVRAWERAARRTPPHAPRAAVSVRPACEEDAHDLWLWRNDPVTRASSRESGEVPYPSHRAWLAASLARTDRLLLIAADGAGKVGSVRWDHRGRSTWEVSIAVAPDRRGQSLAGSLLRAGEESLVRTVAGPVLCLATVHQGNVASQRLFAAAGYVPDAPSDADGFETLVKYLPGTDVRA